MKALSYGTLLATLLTIFAAHAEAREYQGAKMRSEVRAKAADCSPAQTLTEFFVNNVRTAAETGGNTWYDRGNGLPYYEVPANAGNHAIFAGALWMGGIDPAGNLKLAAVRFRQVGNDFWPGPLTVDGSASIEASTCQLWDRFFPMSRQMVETHIYYFTLLLAGEDPLEDPLFENGYNIPEQILNWPAQGDPGLGQSFTLAPFGDFRDPFTGDVIGTPGLYEPSLGDYPLYDLQQEIDCRNRLVTDVVPLFGDFTLYWISNDKGNIHTESQGEPIGMEIQAQMFGFTTNDEINNMTFCNYVLINRGTLNLENTYFAQWADTDLGNFNDDFIGCDVQRGLGYSYNGDNDDEGSGSGPGYGEQPPAIGIDFFEGPFQDPDGINNSYGIGANEALNGLGYRNPADSLRPGGIDEIIDNERFGMRRFLFHNNNSGPGPTQDPTIAIHYYNFMRGLWRNSLPMTFGGTGFNPNDPNALNADFMFPGDTDPLHWGTGGVNPNYSAAGGWTEENEGTAPADRRFVQSAGPFVLEPGEFNNITVGVVYARAQTGVPFASVILLRQADDKAQSLFENCFRLLDGPDAPELTHQELDREIILYISNNSPLSNNNAEQYEELDPTIPPTNLEGEQNDQFYRFQGYQVFQLANADVSVSEIENPVLARLVWQSDIRDFKPNGEPIGQLINYEQNDQIGLPVPTEKVNGANEGIAHSLQITTDRFASGDNRLINFKRYYYVAVAYGYNEYQPYNPDPVQLSGQAFTYLRGRKGASGDIQPIVAIPHKPAPEQFGTVFTTQYGDGVPVSRIEGQGNGGNDLQLTQASIDKIMEGPVYKADNLEYEPGRGPVNVTIVDPLNVRPAKFELRFFNDLAPGGGYTGEFDDSEWYMVDTNNPFDTIFSQNTIRVANEQIVPEYGIAVTIGQYQYDVVNANATLLDFYPRPLTSNITFPVSSPPWLGGVADQEGSTFLNWIRSGTTTIDIEDGSIQPCFQLVDGSIDPFVYNDYLNLDNDQLFERIIGGTFAPAGLVGAYDCGPQPLNIFAKDQILVSPRDLTALTSVDMRFTSDKSKWSRVPVFEMQPEPDFAQAGAGKMTLRRSLSLDKNGRNQLDPNANIAECTLNGAQAFTQESVAALSAPALSNLLNGLNTEYPQILTAQDLIGLSFGMSWFPGYAFNVETGERVNMAFGENSNFASDNGRDMIWNPSSRVSTTLGTQFVFGGEHYIYTFRNRARERNSATEVPMYDGGQFIYNSLTSGTTNQRRVVFRALNWISVPLLNQGFQFRSMADGLVPGEARMYANVSKPYAPYATTVDELGAGAFPYTEPTTNYDISENFWYPYYSFNTEGLETSTNILTAATNALDLIDIVPNPYYAYSAYEQSRTDNRVKFVNLPVECKIQIFTINGTLIRVLEKDNPQTFLDWNLQNESFIPIAGGLYLIHVQAPGIGERVLKFFASTRPPDLRNF